MTRLATLLILPLIPSSTATHAQKPVEMDEWPVPWEDTRPRDPYVGPDGRVWFVGQVGHYVAALDPGTGEFQRYELESGTGPHNLIVDPAGIVWFAGNRAAHIGRLDPRTGSIRRFDMPDAAAADPHTLVFDGNGDIWFTVQGGNRVGKLTVRTGEVRLVEVPTARARPYGIVVDSKGRPWLNLFGTHKLATIDPRTFELREIALPREGARTRRIGVTSDDRIWYVDHQEGFLGRYDPESGTFTEWPAPSGSAARPYAMAVDDADRVWFVETGVQPNRFVGFDPANETFFSVTEIASGAGAVRHMVFHGPTREVWFGTDAGTIGRARVP